MAFIKKYYGPIILLLAIIIFLFSQFFQSNNFEKLYNDPQSRDIYIFKAADKFSPYQVDMVTNDSLFFFAHPYDFSKSVPAIDQIREDDFKNNIHYIYSRSELDRLLSEKKIIKIYR